MRKGPYPNIMLTEHFRRLKSQTQWRQPYIQRNLFSDVVTDRSYYYPNIISVIVVELYNNIPSIFPVYLVYVKMGLYRNTIQLRDLFSTV